MHVAPVVQIPHAAGPAGWRGALEALAGALARHPALPVTIRLPGAAIEHFARQDRSLLETVAGEGVSWLAGGYSDPILTSLPPAAGARQLEREMLAMDTVGITAAGLWVGDAWEPGLTSLATAAGLPVVFLDAGLLEVPPERPGPVDRAGEAVIAVPVMSSLPQEWPDDALATVRVAASQVEDLAASHAGRLVNPETYLADHAPGGRLSPSVSSPHRNANRETFYRKLLVLTRDQGDRSAGRDVVLRLQSRELLLCDDSPEADVELIRARRTVDRVRHRGDGWVEMRDIDWDADGLPEVWVETSQHTLVLDPAAGTLDVWDDKSMEWPVTGVVPALAGLIMRRLREDGHEPPPLRTSVEGRMEGKAQASLTLAHPLAGSCRVEVTGRTVGMELAVAPSEQLRVGPEIPLNLTDVRLRVDGGEWVDAPRPLAVAGHRFRLTDGRRTMLIASPRPCELFLRPLPERGVVVWPHWLTRGGATYRLAFTPS